MARRRMRVFSCPGLAVESTSSPRDCSAVAQEVERARWQPCFASNSHSFSHSPTQRVQEVGECGETIHSSRRDDKRDPLVADLGTPCGLFGALAQPLFTALGRRWRERAQGDAQGLRLPLASLEQACHDRSDVECLAEGLLTALLV